jgi:ATP-dependent Lon protease
MELENYDSFPQEIPLIIEDDVFLYPFMIAPLFLNSDENIKAVEHAIEESHFNIDLKSLPSGIYLMQIIMPEGSIAKQLVIE